MDRWGNLNMQQKAQLLGIYASKGYTDLASIINHYNTFQAGGTISTPNFVQRYSEGQRRGIKLPNGEVATHKLSYAEQDGKYIVYPNVQPMDYSNPNSPLYDYEDDNWTAFDRALKNNDILQFNTAKEAEEYTKHYKDFGREGYLLNIPSKISLPEPKVKFQQGGSLGKITSLGQWEYPHQITTIPSNNITMKGVNYPVIGVSNTGDTKYMLPDKDYLFEGQYVTEYPVKKFQLGGITTGSYPTYNVPFSDTDDHTWLKWWYSGRTNQIGNAYREYDISYNKNKKPKFLNKYNETGLNDINRNIDIAMKTPINFISLRDNTLLGQYIPEEKAHIDIRRDQENHPSTVLHERIHALNENLTGAHHVKSILGNFLQNPILMQISPETGTVDYREKLNGYVDSYWDNSNEIYSRLMQFRRDTRTSPLKKWNEEDVINLRKNKTLEKYNLDGYTNEFILHLFNDVADNNNKDYSTLV